MKRKICALAGALLLASVSASANAAVQQPSAADADAAAKLTEARAIVAYILPVQNREQMLRDLVHQISAQMATVMPTRIDDVHDAGLTEIMTKFRARVPDILLPVLNAHMPRLLDGMATAYTHEFSLAELKQIHAFADTPAGGHYLSRSAALMGDPAVVESNKAYLADLKTVVAKESDALKAELITYLKAHPDVAEKIVAIEKKEQ